jgi:hypothetical protein
VTEKRSKMNIRNKKLICFLQTPYSTRSQNCEKRLVASSCLCVIRSVRMSGRKQQLSTHLTDFLEIFMFEYASKHGEEN